MQPFLYSDSDHNLAIVLEENEQLAMDRMKKHFPDPVNNPMDKPPIIHRQLCSFTGKEPAVYIVKATS